MKTEITNNYRSKLSSEIRKLRKSKKIPFIQKSGRDLAQILLEKEKKGFEYKKESINKYGDLLKDIRGKLTKKLNKNIGTTLIHKGYLNEIIKNINNFKTEAQIDIAIEIINKGYGIVLMEGLNNFKGLNEKGFQKIYEKLKERGEEKEIIINFNLFIGVDPNEFALNLIYKGEFEYLSRYFHNLNLKDNQEIINKFKESNKEELLAKYLSNFKSLNHDEFAQYLINLKKSDILIKYIENFKGLTDITAQKLIDNNKGKYVAYCLDFFKGPQMPEIAQKCFNLGYINEMKSIVSEKSISTYLSIEQLKKIRNN